MQNIIDNRKFMGTKPEFGVEDGNVPQSTPMKDFFRGKCILLTGGTGFIGRLLVEKMLRVGVRELYLVARPKKDKSARQRMDELCKGPVFDRLRRLDPDFSRRITPIDGDLIHRNLGIAAEEQQKLINNVEIVIHAAADVRFDETLKAAIEVNIRAARDLLDLALKMNKLEVFVHVSTAYSNCPRREIFEKFYEPQCDPYKMMDLAERIERGEVDEDTIITLTPKIISPWPNTYSFTKAMCEDLVKDYGEKLHLAVVRPSIVIATNEDPFPGWTENIYGLNGILTACALGLLRALHLRREYVGDVIPADFVSNTVLAVAWLTALGRSNKAVKENEEEIGKIDEDPFNTKIYNCTTSADNPITWGMVNDDMRMMYEIYPPKRGLWYNCFNYTRWGFLYRVMVIFYHVLPTIGFDIVLTLTRKKFRLMPVYRKIHKFTDALSYFTTNEWLFRNENMKKLCQSLSPEDAEYFPCDVRRMVWPEYIHHYGKGLRLFIGKENINTLPEGKIRRIKMLALHNFVKIAFYLALLSLLYFILRSFNVIDPITFSMWQ